MQYHAAIPRIRAVTVRGPVVLMHMDFDRPGMKRAVNLDARIQEIWTVLPVGFADGDDAGDRAPRRQETGARYGFTQPHPGDLIFGNARPPPRRARALAHHGDELSLIHI